MNNNSRVREFISNTGHWNTKLIFSQLPLEAAMHVIGYPTPRVRTMVDSYIWAFTANGKFSTRSAYLNLLKGEEIDLDGNWLWLWKFQIPAR